MELQHTALTLSVESHPTCKPLFCVGPIPEDSRKVGGERPLDLRNRHLSVVPVPI